MKSFFRKTEKDDAVSPVVGVMLMLVVTIIIAATVAVFATGIGSDMDTIPVAQVSATYSTNGTLAITHVGGDVIDFSEIEVIVSPSAGFSTGYRTMAWTVQPDSNKLFLDVGKTVEFFKTTPGTIHMQGKTDALSTSYGFDYSGGKYKSGEEYPTAVGKYFTLKLVKDGKTITETEVLIRP